MEIENHYMLEFQLTGLANFGHSTRSFLSEIVPGYDQTLF